MAKKRKVINAQFFEAEPLTHDHELKEFLDDRDEPIYFYIVRHHLVEDYNPSSLPAFLVSPTKLTNEQITKLAEQFLKNKRSQPAADVDNSNDRGSVVGL